MQMTNQFQLNNNRETASRWLTMYLGDNLCACRSSLPYQLTALIRFNLHAWTKILGYLCPSKFRLMVSFIRQYIHMFQGPPIFAALLSASCSCLATPLQGAPPWAGGWRLLESPCLDRALAPRPLRCRVTKTGEELWWLPA